MGEAEMGEAERGGRKSHFIVGRRSQTASRVAVDVLRESRACIGDRASIRYHIFAFLSSPYHCRAVVKPNKINMKRDILLIILLVLALAGLGAFFTYSPESTDIDYKPVDVGGGTLTAPEQTSLETVTLAATLVAPGWVTVHQSLGAAPAAIIGTSDYLLAGTYDNLTIKLSEPMLPNYKFIALLHVDDGNQIFESHFDLPVKFNDSVVRVDFLSPKIAP